MENPFDRVGDLFKAIGGGFSGAARYLEQMTGDVVTASVVAAMLLLALSLLKGGASVRNTRLYAIGLVCIGVFGIVAVVAFTELDVKQPEPVKSSDEYIALLKKGAGQSNPIETRPLEQSATKYGKTKWYLLMFSVVTGMGALLTAVTMLLARRRASSKRAT